MGKIVAMVNEDQEVEELCKRIDQRKHFANKKIKDFEKQLHKAQDDLQKDNEGDWELLKVWLENKGRLPSDYNVQTHNIGFSLSNNGVTVGRNDAEDEEGMPFPPGRVKNMGAFRLEDLPAGLQDAFKSFIEAKMTDNDE